MGKLSAVAFNPHPNPLPILGEGAERPINPVLASGVFTPDNKSDNNVRGLSELLRFPPYESLVILQQAVAACPVSWI